MNWAYPPPVEFPDSVDNVRDFAGGLIAEILTNPPLLAKEDVNASCDGLPDHVADVLQKGQEALKAGALHEARVVLEPVAVFHPHIAALCGIACYAMGRVERAVSLWETLYRISENKDTPSLYNSLMVLRGALITQENFLHPECEAMSVLCNGRGVDVGCGGNKTCPNAIGVDLTPEGDTGKYGGQAGVESRANVVASGDYMPMFEDNSLDYVISRHNLEHYQDYIKTLFEWTRVLKPGGVLGVITPDHEWVDTISLDSTHYHVFTQASLENLFRHIPFLEPVYTGPCVPRWSIMAVVQKTSLNSRFNYNESINKREAGRVLDCMENYRREGKAVLVSELAKEAEWLIQNQQ
ncbi:hypothetical protein MNBD_NITROSPINAE01-718 [hydrothermal vent metagenome]|uniref:Methyltransferase type 11 domain-containing protein n=1 Tax=hydrothermal vent metagenome TaxID=652676 RepID=A0A3B1C2N1_9ZZZZ